MYKKWKINGQKLCEFVNQKIDHQTKKILYHNQIPLSLISKLKILDNNERPISLMEHIGAINAYNYILEEFHLQTLFIGDDPYICRCDWCENIRKSEKFSRVEE